MKSGNAKARFLVTFNSTRCIRNYINRVSVRRQTCRLSTPHGALGTQSASSASIILTVLSTPHGALGTSPQVPASFSDSPLLSTPHGALGTKQILCRIFLLLLLSTPHGALGT